MAALSLQSHGHDDVTRMRRARSQDETAAVRVGETDLDLIAVDRAQCVEEVVDVEADLDFLALVSHLDLILRLLLLRVVCLDRQQTRPGGQADAPVLLVRKNRSPLESLAQHLAIRLDGPRRTCRNHTSVLRETAIDQLRSEANIADLGANVISSDGELDFPLGPENALQLEHTLARHDDLVGALRFAGELHLAQRK